MCPCINSIFNTGNVSIHIWMKYNPNFVFFMYGMVRSLFFAVLWFFFFFSGGYNNSLLFLWLCVHLLGNKSHFKLNLSISLSKFWAYLGKTFLELPSNLPTIWNISGRMLMLRENASYTIWTNSVISGKILGSWDLFPIEHPK